jgi:hypothetical protein
MMDGRGSILRRTKEIVLKSVQTGSEAHPAFYTNSTWEEGEVKVGKEVKSPGSEDNYQPS